MISPGLGSQPSPNYKDAILKLRISKESETLVALRGEALLCLEHVQIKSNLINFKLCLYMSLRIQWPSLDGT